MAFEGKDVEVGVELVDLEYVAVVADEAAQICAHGQTSWSVGGRSGKPTLSPESSKGVSIEKS